jgi:hypothetical protein
METEKIYNFTYKDLYDLLLHTYKEGYSQHNIVEAGLESYDPDGIVRWIIQKEDKKNEDI